MPNPHEHVSVDNDRGRSESPLTSSVMTVCAVGVTFDVMVFFYQLLHVVIFSDNGDLHVCTQCTCTHIV